MSWTIGDSEPALTGTVTDAGIGVNLTTALSSVVHILTPQPSIITRAPVHGNQTTAPGSWSLAWQPTDLAIAGAYQAELEVTWTLGRTQTFGPVTFRVQPQIA